MCSTCLNPFPDKPWFLCVCSSSLLKILWEKEKLLVISNFSFSHSAFYLFGEPSAIVNKYKTHSIWSVWERVNHCFQLFCYPLSFCFTPLSRKFVELQTALSSTVIITSSPGGPFNKVPSLSSLCRM